MEISFIGLRWPWGDHWPSWAAWGAANAALRLLNGLLRSNASGAGGSFGSPFGGRGGVDEHMADGPKAAVGGAVGA